MYRFIIIKLLALLLCISLVNCYSTNSSELICEDANCFTVVHKVPLLGDNERGFFFYYGRNKVENSFVHVRFTDAPFYYRWNNDTLVLRCPYWKVVENNIGSNKLFDFKAEFSAEEKIKYGYALDVQQFYKNIAKDFKSVNTYELK